MDNFTLNRYAGFGEGNFISDPFFQDWVLHPNAELEAFWNEFLTRFPEKKTAVQTAKAFLQNLTFTEHIPDENLIRQSFLQHISDIENPEKNRIVHHRTNIWTLTNLLRVAAVFGGIALLTGIYLLSGNKDKNRTVQTAYGQLSSLTLPDSSAIVLNAHSKLAFSNKWQTSGVREVWLDGEAFFNVRHLNDNQHNIQSYERFLVHTGELNIEVLGTSFDVRKRRGTTEVVLQTGKVKLSFINKSQPDIIMKPGDVVTYQPVENRVTRTTAVPEDYAAWKEKKLILLNPTVNEITAYLEDNYGKKIALQEPGMGTRIIEGPIMLNNLDDALFVLSTVLHANIIKKDSSFIIKPK